MQLKKRFTFATSDELSDLRDHGLDGQRPPTSRSSCGLGRLVPSRKRRRPITLLGAGHRRMTRRLVPSSSRHAIHRPAKRELSEHCWHSSVGFFPIRQRHCCDPTRTSGRRGAGAYLTLNEERSSTATGRSGGRAVGGPVLTSAGTRACGRAAASLATVSVPSLLSTPQRNGTHCR